MQAVKQHAAIAEHIARREHVGHFNQRDLMALGAQLFGHFAADVSAAYNDYAFALDGTVAYQVVLAAYDIRQVDSGTAADAASRRPL